MIDVTGVLVLSPVISSSEIKHLPLFRYEHVKIDKRRQLRINQMALA